MGRGFGWQIQSFHIARAAQLDALESLFATFKARLTSIAIMKHYLNRFGFCADGTADDGTLGEKEERDGLIGTLVSIAAAMSRSA